MKLIERITGNGQQRLILTLGNIVFNSRNLYGAGEIKGIRREIEAVLSGHVPPKGQQPLQQKPRPKGSPLDKGQGEKGRKSVVDASKKSSHTHSHRSK